MSRHDHHRPCPCGAELSDECPRCNSINPLGSMRIEPAIGSFKPIRGLTEAQAEQRRQPYPIGGDRDSAGAWAEERDYGSIHRRFVAELRDRVERCDEAERLRAFDWLVQECPDSVRLALDETGATS